MSRRLAGLVLVAALGMAGCATIPPAVPPPTPPRIAASPRDTVVRRHEVVRAAAPVAAAPDTVPSADALAVLAGIPEPLSGAERSVRTVPAPAPQAAAPDTAGDQGGAADVPVPVPTRVLGDRPLPEVVPPGGPAAAFPAPAGTAASPLQATPAATDTCWRVQFAAWAERAKAERYLEAVRSQLGVEVGVDRQAGLFKVRTSGCLEGSAADALRRRARDAGFEGAFRFRGERP